MKVMVFSQAFCGPCRTLKPHIEAATAKLNIDLTYIDITDNWDIAKEYGFSSTPAVYLEQAGSLTTIHARTTLALMKELEGLIDA